MQDESLGQCYLRVSDVTNDYYDRKTGKIATDKELLNTLNRIKIPKTYKDVVICPDPRNDLIAQAVDGKGQLQYFYSDIHKEKATRSKNCNLIHFGETYQRILDDIQMILESRNASPDLVLHALALRIMTLCHFRPGGTHNLKENGTYGLTTMQWDHYTEDKNVAKISFKGKKNQTNSCIIRDPVALNLLSKLNTNHNNNKPLLSHEGFTVIPKSLNDFLHSYHPSITTKTWRTWFANLSYIDKITNLGVIPDSQRDRKILSNRVIKTVAEELHHTLAINKRNYLIPELDELFVKDPNTWVDMLMSTSDSKEFLLRFLGGYCVDYNDDIGINVDDDVDEDIDVE